VASRAFLMFIMLAYLSYNCLFSWKVCCICTLKSYSYTCNINEVSVGVQFPAEAGIDRLSDSFFMQSNGAQRLFSQRRSDSARRWPLTPSSAEIKKGWSPTSNLFKWRPLPYSSGLQHRVFWLVITIFWEGHTASIFRVRSRIGGYSEGWGSMCIRHVCNHFLDYTLS
jgi:hypothetical protein